MTLLYWIGLIVYVNASFTIGIVITSVVVFKDISSYFTFVEDRLNNLEDQQCERDKADG